MNNFVKGKVNILISPSNDGEIITAACKGLGFKIIRGSKGRKGAVQAVFQRKSGEVFLQLEQH